jgi:hypothetical protein
MFFLLFFVGTLLFGATFLCLVFYHKQRAKANPMPPVGFTFTNLALSGIWKSVNETHPKQNGGNPTSIGTATCLVFFRRAAVTGCPPRRQDWESYCLRPYSCSSDAWAAASRAIGTRNGEQET